MNNNLNSLDFDKHLQTMRGIYKKVHEKLTESVESKSHKAMSTKKQELFNFLNRTLATHKEQQKRGIKFEQLHTLLGSFLSTPEDETKKAILQRCLQVQLHNSKPELVASILNNSYIWMKDWTFIEPLYNAAYALSIEAIVCSILTKAIESKETIKTDELRGLIEYFALYNTLGIAIKVDRDSLNAIIDELYFWKDRYSDVRIDIRDDRKDFRKTMFKQFGYSDPYHQPLTVEALKYHYPNDRETYKVR